MGSNVAKEDSNTSEEIVPPLPLASGGHAIIKNSASLVGERGGNQRFTDVGKEPDKMLAPLPPIMFHQHANSTSLQEVIKPICHLVEDLPERTALSLNKCKNPKDGLTVDESAAIYLYTQQWPDGKISFYTMFNRALRDENRVKLAPFHQYLNLFMSAFNKLPSTEDHVWRGESGDWGNQFKSDTIHVWWGVSSCTDKVHVTGDFLDETKKRTLFNIKCRNGKMIKNHSAFPTESETILPPGTYLKVKSSLNFTPTVCIVDLEEIKPTKDELAQLATDNSGSIVWSTPKVKHIYILWLDPNINISKENQKIQEKFKELFDQKFKPFERLEEMVDYIQDKDDQCFLLITGGQIGREIVPKVNNFSQLQNIVIYCMDKSAHMKWSKEYEKVKAVVVQEYEMIKTVQELHRDLTEQEKILSNNKKESSNLELCDNLDAPQNLHSPLKGVNNVSLRSLEETLKGFDDLIPDIQQQVYIAKSKCKDPADGLARDESAAIMIYTMEWGDVDHCLYGSLNQSLRSEKRDVIKRWFPYLRLLICALSKLPSYKGTVYRSERLDLKLHYEVGSQTIWWAVTSTSSKMSSANNGLYFHNHGPRTLFVIECRNGRYIHNHSPFPEEEEILLLPGTQLEVTDKSVLADGLTMISLKEIDSPYSLY